MSVAAVPVQETSEPENPLHFLWAFGPRRILTRRLFLTCFAAAIALILAGGCLLTCLHAAMRPWFAGALAASAIAAFLLFLLWLYEHARSEELIEQWITALPQRIGCHPTAAEVLSWAQILFGLQEEGQLAPWRRAIVKEPLNQCVERLLGYGEELASLAIQRDPLNWRTHAELAQILSARRALMGADYPGAEEMRHKVLDELAILQSLQPQSPECWECIQECAALCEEAEVELMALERLSNLLPEPEPLIRYGRALFRYGFAGRGFALYRQLHAEDPETANAILAGYTQRLESFRAYS